jgi:hypothetical protein
LERGAKLTVRIEAQDADEDELDRLTRQLLAEVRDHTEVDQAELVLSNGAPAGAKAAGIVELGTLLVQVQPKALPGLLGMLREWATRPRTQSIKVVLQVEGRSVDLDYLKGAMTQDDLMQLVVVVSGDGRRVRKRARS